MAKFSYKATERNGNHKTGTLEAVNEAAVIQTLREQNLIPISISAIKTKASKGSTTKGSVNIFQRVRHVDLMNFTTTLSTLLESGIQLDRCLAISTDLTENVKMKGVVQDIRRKVQGGASFADALSQHPKTFNRLYVNMVRSGEAGGVLEAIIQRLSGFLETSQALRQEIVSASIYPLILALVGSSVVIFMVTFVLPKFSVIFVNLGADLPWITRLLVDGTEFLKHYWYFILGGVFIAFVAWKQFVETKDGRKKWDQFKLNLPLLGDLFQKIEIARFARTLGTLVRSGVPILQALSIVKEIIGNVVISNSLLSVYSRLKEGGGLSAPLKDTGCFPPLVVHMIAVGEETGSIEAMLLKVADTYENDVKVTVNRVMSLLEPLIILVMGVVVAFVVVAMLMAVFSVSDIAI